MIILFFLYQFGKMKKFSDVLNKEIDQCKEMIWVKDKVLEVSVVEKKFEFQEIYFFRFIKSYGYGQLILFCCFFFQDVQKNYIRIVKELNRVRSEYFEMENGMVKMRIILQSFSSNFIKDRRRVQEFLEEVKGELY